MNRPLTAEYIVELFEGVKDCRSEADWEHNKKRFVELIKEYGTEQCNIANVVSRFSFDEREPEISAYVSLVWEDGSDCECIYDGLDKSILPLPTHWYYVS